MRLFDRRPAAIGAYALGALLAGFELTVLWQALHPNVSDDYRAYYIEAGVDERKEEEMLEALRGAIGPEGRIRIDVNQAWSIPQAARLLAVYHRRLRSNLVHALRPRLGDRAGAVADTVGALIDGVYLRAVLARRAGPDPDRAAALVSDYLHEVLS